MATNIHHCTEVARLANDLRKQLAQFRSSAASDIMVSRFCDDADRIASLAHEHARSCREMKDAARVFFGRNRTLVHKYPAGAAGLRETMFDALKKIEETSRKKERNY